jgi:hypothetical protein
LQLLHPWLGCAASIIGSSAGCVGGGGTNVKQAKLRFDEAFRVALNGRNAQVAEMVLAPGGSEGGPENRHRGATSGCSLSPALARPMWAAFVSAWGKAAWY